MMIVDDGEWWLSPFLVTVAGSQGFWSKKSGPPSKFFKMKPKKPFTVGKLLFHQRTTISHPKRNWSQRLSWASWAKALQSSSSTSAPGGCHPHAEIVKRRMMRMMEDGWLWLMMVVRMWWCVWLTCFDTILNALHQEVTCRITTESLKQLRTWTLGTEVPPNKKIGG